MAVRVFRGIMPFQPLPRPYPSGEVQRGREPLFKVPDTFSAPSAMTNQLRNNPAARAEGAVVPRAGEGIFQAGRSKIRFRARVHSRVGKDARSSASSPMTIIVAP